MILSSSMTRDVDHVNATLARYEQIKYFTILDRTFDVATGELTPTMKIKRRVVNEKFKDQIENMYNKSKSGDCFCSAMKLFLMGNRLRYPRSVLMITDT